MISKHVPKLNVAGILVATRRVTTMFFPSHVVKPKVEVKYTFPGLSNFDSRTNTLISLLVLT